MAAAKNTSDNVARFSVSLPANLLDQLDRMVSQRNMPSRSHAIAEMVRTQLLEHNEQAGQQMMAGTITMVYSNAKNQLRNQLAQIQTHFLKEVISSQHVFLEDNHSLEVLLVQGPATTLENIRHKIANCKGVKQVKLNITTSLLPPLHALTKESKPAPRKRKPRS